MTVLAASTPWPDFWELLGPAVSETLQMVGAVLVIALVVGTPLAVILHNTAVDGLFPAQRLHAVLGWIVNLGRSLPFLILMTAIIPLTPTAVMVRLGHVYENLMIDLVDTNEKLSDRSLRILAEASGKSLSAAGHALRKSGHNLRIALVMLKKQVDAAVARKLLKNASGNLRKALGEDYRTKSLKSSRYKHG